MMMRLAEEFGFRIRAFEHILEGYKVADVMAKHGAGGSTFSDWWGYKLEVYDAIPYNGALMHDQGVLVSFNSDSDELSRRLNWDAAKAVKYGGLPEEEALKFVTLNPARQLKVDNRVGSLEPGKDADFVIWSGSPLSVYSHCEQTWIDGRKYFDREEDRQLYEEAQRQRAVLIQKALLTKKTPGPAPGAEKPDEKDDQGNRQAWLERPGGTTMNTLIPRHIHCSRPPFGVFITYSSDQIPAKPQDHPIAIVGATIHTVSGPTIEKGTILFDKGKILAVGTGIDHGSEHRSDRRLR